MPFRRIHRSRSQRYQLVRPRTNAALLDLVVRLSLRRPLLISFEDIHWIDPTTGEWLDCLVDRIRDLPVLLILSFRPEFEPRWKDRSHVTALSLGPIARDEGAVIADRVAGGKQLPREVADQILTKSEGVPLFIEELTKAVIESGVLADTGGSYTLPGPLPGIAVPATLQDSLMARLDRLGSAKEVAQQAPVWDARSITDSSPAQWGPAIPSSRVR